MAEFSRIGIWGFTLSVLVYVCSAVPKAPVDKKAPVQETFKITLEVYSGRENPTWLLDLGSKKKDVQDVVEKLRAMDMHAHGHHGAAHGTQTKVGGTEATTFNGYNKISILHTFGNGESHTIEIRRCQDPFLEWKIITKTSPEKTVSDNVISHLKTVLMPCAREELRKLKLLKKTKSTDATASKTNHAHKHEGHVH